MVRDEADIVAATVGQMLTQVDHVIVADNRSTDGTREILEGLPVTIVEDSEVGYHQSRKMSALAAQACERGADWVVPFDADEWWYSPFGRIADVLAELPPWFAVVTAALYDHVATGIDPDEPDPTRRLGWRRQAPAELAKVACRPSVPVTIQQGNHAATFEAMVADGLVVRHFPYRSPEQFVRKACNGAEAYAATDLPENVGQHWRGYGRIAAEQGDEACAAIFREWFWVADPTESLIFDPVGVLT